MIIKWLVVTYPKRISKSTIPNAGKHEQSFTPPTSGACAYHHGFVHINSMYVAFFYMKLCAEISICIHLHICMSRSNDGLTVVFLPAYFANEPSCVETPFVATY